MSVLHELIAFLRGGTTRLKPLEASVMEAVVGIMDDDRADRLEQRLEEVNLVQRHDGGREVNCYQMKRGRPVFNEASRIAPIEGEVTLARFHATVGAGTSLSGKVDLVNGHFFSLEFDQPTEHFLDERPSRVAVRVEGL